MVCLSRPYPFKFFKGCLPQVLLGPFLNALSHIKQLFAYLIWRNYRRQRDHPRKAMKLWRKPLEILILSVNYTFHFCFRFSWAVLHIISNRQAYDSFYVLISKGFGIKAIRDHCSTKCISKLQHCLQVEGYRLKCDENLVPLDKINPGIAILTQWRS